MESPFLSQEQIEWECRRVAAAFGVVEFEWSRDGKGQRWSGFAGATEISWMMNNKGVSFIEVGPQGWGHELMLEQWQSEPPEWWFREADYPRPEWKEHTVRGLYCLGIEEEGVLAQINVPLSMHEKMELRLTMPRELWPQKWLDEEVE